MARILNLLVISAATVTQVASFAPLSNYPITPSRVAQADTFVQESFGFDFAEDQAENTPDVILGEANYKQWVGQINDNSFLNRQYAVVRRVRELNLLGLTAELGLLSKLEKNGVDLEVLEGLLPAAEKLGLLSLVANNQQLLLNGVAPLLVEPAPYLLPAVAGALDVGPPAFFLLSAALFGSEYFLLANEVEVPFLGLSAGVFLGLLIVPLGVISGGAGIALNGLKK